MILPNGEKCYSISCGLFHSICITTLGNFITRLILIYQIGNCYVWGWNIYGQLGLRIDKTNYSHKPTLLKLPNNEKIYHISCGYSHTVCISQTGICYGFGDNNSGRLGLPSNRLYIDTPTVILPNERMKYASCGSDYTVCITINNIYYVFGDNYYGQLGLSSEMSMSPKPTMLNLPNNEHIRPLCKTWKKMFHKYATVTTRCIVMCLLMIIGKDKNGVRRHNTPLSILPKDIILYICEYLSLY